MNVSIKVLVEAAILLAVAAFLTTFACTTTNNNAATCAGLCTNEIVCGQTLNQCLSACNQLESSCTSSGHPATFQAYAGCATDAGFSCTDAGTPVANAPCGPVQNDLVQCQVVVDGGFDIPDGALAADMMCICGSSPDCSCVECCRKNHVTGANAFAAAALACACGNGGGCKAQCTEECAKPGAPDSGPQANDPCDQCLTRVLDDQASPPGACVVPVTAACNRTLDCALYVNCTTQAGCTN